MKHGWEYKRLIDVCDGASTINWDTASSKQYIDLSSVDRESHKVLDTTTICKANAPSRAKQIVKLGDVIFGTTRPLLKRVCLIVPEYDKQVCSTGFCVLRPQNMVLPMWVYYCLQTDRFYSYIEPLQKGISYPAVSNDDVRNYVIPLPPLPVQEQICSLLDKINRVIEAKKEQLKELDNLAQAIFYDMFGDPVTNEKGWETSTIDTISTEKLSYGSGASAVEYDGQTRYIRITDINDLGDLNEDVKSPSEIDDKYLLKEGDILFARSGATVGKTYCHNEKNGRCIYAGYLIKMRPNTSKVLPKYIFYYTKSEYYKAFIRNAQNAVAQPNINAKQYGALIIPIPSLPLQQAFAEKVEAIERQKELINQSLREVQTLFDSRMDYWFSEEDDDLGQLDKLD